MKKLIMKYRGLDMEQSRVRAFSKYKGNWNQRNTNANIVLDFKAKNKIQQGQINQDLVEAQMTLSSSSENDAKGKKRKKAIIPTGLKLEFWKKHARSNQDDLGDQSTSFFYKWNGHLGLKRSKMKFGVLFGSFLYFIFSNYTFK